MQEKSHLSVEEPVATVRDSKVKLEVDPNREQDLMKQMPGAKKKRVSLLFLCNIGCLSLVLFQSLEKLSNGIFTQLA